MNEQFQREQQILERTFKHLNDVRDGLPFDINVLETITKEYDNLLKQMQQVLKISDKASIGLLNEKNIQQEQIIELENELLQSKISIMLSQIQPHFIYNSLNAIKGLCLIDPGLARETIEEFSRYLRVNLDSLSINKPVDFEREFQHVTTYLSLEKKRFNDKLNILYYIDVKNFLIPALTLQPIVENAVRHGVTKREFGGTVTIKTEDTGSDVVISVIDDGVGFDTASMENNDRINVGISNVKKRLLTMCHGTLSIHSIPDTGTTAIIKIPKEGNMI